jgi:RNA polymerase sigma factor (sigma-70 family)
VDSDEALFAKIKAGQDVLGEIVIEINRRYGNGLLKFCEGFLPTYSRDRVEDVLQEIYEAVHRSIQQYDISRGPEGIKNWLYGIARNKCYDVQRKLGPEVPRSDFIELESSNPGIQEEEKHRFQRILLKSALAELRPDDRLMITTGLSGWFSRAEMAKMFGYKNLESFDKRISRIEKKMRKIIEGKDDVGSK